MSRPKSPAEYAARAVAAFEAGFTTKAAKQDALKDLSAAYGMMRNAIQERVLDASGPERQMTAEQSDLYWGLPDALNNWRPKHAALVLRVFPDVAEGLKQIDRLLELRAKLAAADVAPKAPTRGEREKAIRLSATGRAYAAEFGKLAPELERDFENHVIGAYDQLVRRYGDEMAVKLQAAIRARVVPADVRRQDAEMFSATVAGFLTPASLRGGAAQLDRARLDARAKAYAQLQIDQFVVKLTQKLGDLTDVTIKRADPHGFQCVIEGALGARRVRVEQSRKFVVNQNGTAFHQWPALIYVDGKFTTEAAFKRLASGA